MQKPSNEVNMRGWEAVCEIHRISDPQLTPRMNLKRVKTITQIFMWLITVKIGFDNTER